MKRPDDIKEPEDYLFIFEEPNNGWWYKIDSVDRLIDYQLKVAWRYSEALADIVNHFTEYKENYNYTVFENKLSYPIIMMAEKYEVPVLKGAELFRQEYALNQLHDIQKNGYILVNPAGGYHSGPVEYKDWVRKKSYVYPSFKESDIVIKQFPNGTHYYVRIGDMSLHNEDGGERFFSESDARIAANRYIELGGANKHVDEDFVSSLLGRLEEES